MRPAIHSRHKTWRSGVALLEIAIVGTFAAILCGVLAAYFQRGDLAEVGAAGDARRLAIDLYQIQQRAARGGVTYTVEFSPSAMPTQYTIYRREEGALEVETVRLIPASLRVSPNYAVLRYNQTGLPIEKFTITFSSGSSRQTVSVSASDGTVCLR